jgi:hypothetical protein
MMGEGHAGGRGVGFAVDVDQVLASASRLVPPYLNERQRRQRLSVLTYHHRTNLAERQFVITRNSLDIVL